MRNQLTFQLERKQPNESLVDATVAAKILDAMLDVIQGLDRAATGASDTVGWNISAASIGSLGLAVQPYLKDVRYQVDLDALCTRHASVIGSITAVTKKGEVSLSDGSLRKVQKAIELAQQASHGLWVGENNNIYQYEITAASPEDIDEILHETTFSIGSIEGKLELLDLHRDKTIVFAIWDYLGNKIQCQYDREDGLYDVMKRGIDKRVRVFGRIKRNNAGTPRQIQVQRIHIIKDVKDLPSLDDMVGTVKLDMPGDQYVRSLRDA